jgi:hypothetical protein
MADMNAESTKKSLVVQGGNSLQPSARAVAVRSTPTVDELSKKQLIVLMALFQELLNNTLSPDVRYLAAASAIDRVSSIMDPKEAKEIVIQLMSVRHGQVMDSMF